MASAMAARKPNPGRSQRTEENAAVSVARTHPYDAVRHNDSPAARRRPLATAPRFPGTESTSFPDRPDPARTPVSGSARIAAARPSPGKGDAQCSRLSGSDRWLRATGISPKMIAGCMCAAHDTHCSDNSASERVLYWWMQSRRHFVEVKFPRPRPRRRAQLLQQSAIAIQFAQNLSQFLDDLFLRHGLTSAPPSRIDCSRSPPARPGPCTRLATHAPGPPTPPSHPNPAGSETAARHAGSSARAVGHAAATPASARRSATPSSAASCSSASRAGPSPTIVKRARTPRSCSRRTAWIARSTPFHSSNRPANRRRSPASGSVAFLTCPAQVLPAQPNS